ncbi:unnamed protein product [Bursaphelenchus xylophilus]|uniref:Aminopeptidase n=1 Tax=Bursaphelenchus xylophilus TaxID=6326 RepID=A0A1I7RSE9_BURXY|nr:unnamed protein product [Bursaphelenchus xylophilus]CAG9123002.1 unnamed protein product [Bursaphelenchus xylophilus]
MRTCARGPGGYADPLLSAFMQFPDRLCLLISVFRFPPLIGPAMNSVTKPVRHRRADLLLLCSFGLISMVLSSSLVLLFHIFGNQVWPFYDQPPPFRLPNSMAPYFYDLNLKLYPILDAEHDFGEHNNTIHGQMDVHFKCHESTSILILNAYDLVISQDLMIRDLDEIELIQVMGVKYYSVNRQIVLFLRKPLSKGHKYGLLMNYVAKIGDEGLKNKDERTKVGAFTSPLDTNEIEKVLVTHFQFFEASRVFPCFDEPDKKANFNLNLIYPATYNALANMPALRTHFINRQWAHTEFEMTPLMSPYLFGFYIGKFGILETEENGIIIRFNARNDTLEKIRPARDIAVKAVSYFQKYFGIKFPLPKLDFIVVGTLAVAGMENWGIVTVRDSEVIFDYGVSDDDRMIQRTAELITHEVCHQWFGNIVGPKSWDDFWFFEAMTAYASSKAIPQIMEDQYFETLFEFRDKEMSLDVNEYADVSIRTKIDRPLLHKDLGRPIYYQQGHCVVKMLEDIVGEEVMRASFQEFLRKYSYGSATSKDFFRIIDEILELEGHYLYEIGLKTSEFVESWASNRGLPLISVNLLNETHSVVSQSVYNPIRANDGKAEKAKWHVPIFYTSNGKEKLRLLKNGEPVIIGAKTISHKVLYPIRHEVDLLPDLVDDITSEEERVHFFLNLVYITLQNDLPLDTVLDAMRKLLDTDSRLSVMTYVILARQLSIIFYSHPLRAKMELFLRKPLEDAFDEYVINYKSGFTIHQQHIAEILMAFMCELEYEPCVSLALNYLRDVRMSCENSTDKDGTCIDFPIPLRRGIFNTIMTKDNREDIDFLKSMTTRRNDGLKLQYAFSYQPYESKETHAEDENPIIMVIAHGKRGSTFGLSVNVIKYAHYFITENCKNSAAIAMQYIAKTLEYASLYGDDFIDDFMTQHNCTEMFSIIRKNDGEHACNMLKRRGQVRRDIYLSNEQILSTFLTDQS